MKLIRNSRYLVMITGLIAIGCLTTCILGYQFKLLSKEHFGAGTEGFLPKQADGSLNYNMAIPIMLAHYFPSGMLGLGVVLFVFVLQSKYKLALLVPIVILAVLAFQRMDRVFEDRYSSIFSVPLK